MLDLARKEPRNNSQAVPKLSCNQAYRKLALIMHGEGFGKSPAPNGEAGYSRAAHPVVDAGTYTLQLIRAVTSCKNGSLYLWNSRLHDQI